MSGQPGHLKLNLPSDGVRRESFLPEDERLICHRGRMSIIIDNSAVEHPAHLRHRTPGHVTRQFHVDARRPEHPGDGRVDDGFAGEFRRLHVLPLLAGQSGRFVARD